MMQRQISIDREEPEAGLEALEEPLKAKKPRDKWPGRSAERYPCINKAAIDSKLHITIFASFFSSIYQTYTEEYYNGSLLLLKYRSLILSS